MTLHVTVQKGMLVPLTWMVRITAQPGLSLISSEVCASVCTHNKRVVGLIVEHVEFWCSLRVLQLPPPKGQRHACEADTEL